MPCQGASPRRLEHSTRRSCRSSRGKKKCATGAPFRGVQRRRQGMVLLDINWGLSNGQRAALLPKDNPKPLDQFSLPRSRSSSGEVRAFFSVVYCSRAPSWDLEMDKVQPLALNPYRLHPKTTIPPSLLGFSGQSTSCFRGRPFLSRSLGAAFAV